MGSSGVNFDEAGVEAERSRNIETKKSKSSSFLRSLSRKCKKSPPTAVQDGNEESALGPKAVSQKLARTKTGRLTLTHKEKALLKYPFLSIEQFSGNAGADLIQTGANSIRAETLDMVTMAGIMQDNIRQLTHDCVDRFFEWFPLFGVYLERYFYVEEDIIMKWVIEKGGACKGKMRTSNRMMLRGKLQKKVSDLMDMQELFPRNMPPGERMGLLLVAVDEFALQVIEYLENLTTEVPILINMHYDKSACEKLKVRWVRHVVNHVGTADFLVLYTRWMPQKDLREWKTKILFRTEFKYAAYTTWEKDMDFAHFSIVAHFAEFLRKENKENDAEQGKVEFSKNKNAVHQHMNPEEEENDSDEYSDEGSDIGEFAQEQIVDDGK